MYEIVSSQTQMPLVAVLEAQIEACYHSDSSQSQQPTEPSVVSLSLVQRHHDQLRHYVTHSEDGFYLDIRFTHDEFEFLDAMSKWLARLSSDELRTFPDLAEMVISEFRRGEPMEALPVTRLKAYSARWESSLWENILAFKKLNRDLHEHYQQALKQWDALQTA